MADAPEDHGGLASRVGEAGFVQRLFDELPLMIVAFDGPELRIAAATGAYRAFAEREHMIGRPVREVFSEAVGQQLIEVIEQVYRTGQPVSLRDIRAQMERPGTRERIEFFADVDLHPWRGP